MTLDNMTDEQLEVLASRPRIERGLAPWAAWESETTGLGAAFRRMAGYPSWLPLFITSDHYVDPLIALRANEIKPEFNLYVSWNRRKVERMRDFGIRALHITHPWFFLKHTFSQTFEKPQGTLIFWPHSIPGLHQNIEATLLVERIMALPEFYRPFTICIHAQDIQLGLHRKLRDFKLGLVTAGDVTSQRFPQRFFRILNRFRYTAGPGVGSHTFYALASFRPYRLVGMDLYGFTKLGPDGAPVEITSQDIENTWRENYPTDSLYSSVLAFRNSLELDLVKPTAHQISFSRENLGIYAPNSQELMRKTVWKQLERNKTRLLRLYTRPIRRSFGA